MPDRLIRESWCASETIDRLTPFEETVFARMIVNCDDFGRMDGRASVVCSRLFVTRRSIREKTVMAAVRRLEEEGQVLNFSVPGKEEDICQASSQIADFCQENGMTPRQVMRFSLAIEEVLTMIALKNPDGQVRFDLRAFAVPGSLGIRIRYDGIAYDPFAPRGKKDEAYLGIDLIASMMSTVFYQRTFGLNTVQLLL